MHFKLASVTVLGALCAVVNAADLPSCVAKCIPASAFGTCGHNDAACLCLGQNGAKQFYTDALICIGKTCTSTQDSIGFEDFCSSVSSSDYSSYYSSIDASYDSTTPGSDAGTATDTGAAGSATAITSTTTAAAAATSSSSTESGSSSPSPSSHPNSASQHRVSITLALMGLSAVHYL